MNVRLGCISALFALTAAGAVAQEPPAPTSRPAETDAATTGPAPEAPARVDSAGAVAAPDAAAPAVAADGSPAGTVPAIWVSKEISFTYMGSTSLYYCEGLRNKVRWVLKQLGLMDGYKVRVRSCFNTGGPEIRYGPAGPEFNPGAEFSPRIVIEAVVPQQVTSELLDQLDEKEGERELVSRVRGESTVVDNAEAQFAASRRRVTFDDNVRRSRIEAGDCELIEQMRDYVFVPLGFKVVEDKMNCVPNRILRGSVSLELEVLEPWTPAPESGQSGDPAAAP